MVRACGTAFWFVPPARNGLPGESPGMRGCRMPVSLDVDRSLNPRPNTARPNVTWRVWLPERRGLASTEREVPRRAPRRRGPALMLTA